MTSEALAQFLVRAACSLAAGFCILWPWLSSGRVGVLAFVLAAPFILAGLPLRRLGPPIGKGLMVVATLAAFYDPPSAIAFSADRFALALPFFALALMLALPALPQPSPGRGPARSVIPRWDERRFAIAPFD